jgi:hypothetical protein
MKVLVTGGTNGMERVAKYWRIDTRFMKLLYCADPRTG